MLQLRYLVLVFACTASVFGASLVPKCKPNDSKCAKASAQAAVPMFAAGIPELGVETLDPLHVKQTDASSPNLKLLITDYTITGMKNCVIKKSVFEQPKSRILLKLLCSTQLEGSYDMKGRLLILPIDGNGPIHVTLRKVEISVEIDVAEIEKNGVKHWDIKNWRHSYELKDKADVVFENLFGGKNEVLAKAATDVIKESGNEIVLEVGSPVIKDIVTVVIDNINNFFHAVPLSELVE